MAYQLTPINTVLLPDFQSYTDQYGLITDNNQGNPSGNGILFTAHYAVGLVEKKLINDEERERIIQVLESCQREPGLFMRSPVGQTNYQAHDDLVGILGGEAKLVPDKRNRKLSQAMFTYGSNTNPTEIDQTETDASKQSQNNSAFTALKLLGKPIKWVFNTKNPNTFHVNAWLGLRREVISTIIMASGNSISLVDWLYWAVSMMTLSDSSSNNSYILNAHSCWAVEGYGPLTDWVVAQVRKKIKAKYGDFGKLLGTYFQDQAHPIIKLLDGVVE